MLNINKIGLGTVQFGLPYGISNSKGQTKEDECTKILELAKFYGINTLDTASAYGNAEEVLGQNQIEKFNIISKFMPEQDFGRIEAQLLNSLEKLNVTSLYGYLAHRPLDLLINVNQWNKLKQLKQKGLIKKIGFSLNEPSELEKLLENKLVPDLIQVPFNYFDQRFKKQMILLKEQGCEIHTRSTFLQGLFFTDPSKLNSYFDCFKNEINRLQTEYKSDLPEVLLNFVLNKSYIDNIIIGVENSEQLKKNVEGKTDHAILTNYISNIDPTKLMPLNWPKK